jgi:hypothetical protein
MTTETGERKRTAVSVRSAESTSGRYGPQWTLTVSYPWSKGKTSRAWIARDEFTDTIEPGMYECLVEKGAKWADDTEEDWGYNWKIVEFGSGAVVGEVDRPAPLPARDPTRASIERQTSLNRAVDLMVADIVAKNVTEWDRNDVLANAEAFCNWLSSEIATRDEFDSLGGDDEHHAAER